jgi:hypothetical protein
MVHQLNKSLLLVLAWHGSLLKYRTLAHPKPTESKVFILTRSLVDAHVKYQKHCIKKCNLITIATIY